MFVELPDWRSFLEEVGELDVEPSTPVPKRMPSLMRSNTLVMAVVGPQPSGFDFAIDDDLVNRVLETPPLSARHAGVTSDVKAAKSASKEAKTKNAVAKKETAKSKITPPLGTLKMSTKNIKSRAYHKAHKEALRNGKSEKQAKEHLSTHRRTL